MKWNHFFKRSSCYYQPQMTCIIDPVLALSVQGVPLIQQLGKEMELWIARELWHILDSSSFYLQHPELITPKGIGTSRTPQQERAALEETLWSIKIWEKFRTETDLAGMNLFWLGDNLRESLLPKSRNLEIFWQWEALTKSLDSLLDTSETVDYILPLAFRDTVALAVSLDSAFILTYQQKADFEKNLPPEICQTLQLWGISCEVLTLKNSLVSRERDCLRQLLASFDNFKFLWAELNLTVLHLRVPESLKKDILAQNLPFSKSSLAPNTIENPKMQDHSWIGARGLWYFV